MVAVDDSEHSARTLRYVRLRDTRNVQVTLFHVLKPMPRELLEHSESEDPAEEIRLLEKLRQDEENLVHKKA